MHEVPEYTIHLQNYPRIGARAAIAHVLARWLPAADSIRLIGDPRGFEADIAKLKAAGFTVQDDTRTPREQWDKAVGELIADINQ